jgi:hypothetical protein
MEASEYSIKTSLTPCMGIKEWKAQIRLTYKSLSWNEPSDFPEYSSS